MGAEAVLDGWAEGAVGGAAHVAEGRVVLAVSREAAVVVLVVWLAGGVGGGEGGSAGGGGRVAVGSRMGCCEALALAIASGLDRVAGDLSLVSHW